MSRLEDIRDAAKARLAQQQGGRQDAPASGVETLTPTAQVLEMPVAKDPYQAFGAPTPDSQIRLIIYAKQMFMMPRYDVLYDVAFTGRYDFIGLIFPHQRVRIYGRNLAGLVVALRTNSAEFLREYVPTIHELPEDDGTLPVIEEIQIDAASEFEQDLKGGNG